jgi:hypothetical protein
MKIKINLVLLVLITSCSENVVTIRHPAGDATFGTEIEFRGVKQLPSLMCGPTLYYNQDGKIGKLGAKIAKKSSFGVGLGLVSMLNSDSRSDHENKLELTEAIGTATALGAGAGGLLYSYSIYCEKNRQKSDKAYDAKLKNALEEMCKREDCELSSFEAKHWWATESYEDYKITFKDNVEVYFTHDPSVIEVKSNPLTAKKFEEHTELLQRVVWDTLKDVGLTTPMFDGPWNGGHIHIGVNEGFDSVIQLRNFLVDLVNHSELAEGILGADAHEAESLRFTDQGKRIKEVVEKLDQLIKKNGTIRSTSQILKQLQKDGYPIVYNSKFQTIELRFLRSQKDAKTLSLITSMFQARLDYLKNLKELVQFSDKFPEMKVSLQIENFKKYIEEAKLNYDEYKELLPNRMRLEATKHYYSCWALLTNFLKNSSK